MSKKDNAGKQDNLEDIPIFEEDEEDEEVNLTGTGLQPIVTGTADVEVASLHEKYNKGRLQIQPFFQRQFVWDPKKCSRLIESAILRVPLPAIYLFEEEDGTISVIDGQQRLTAFFSFIRGTFPQGKVFKLSGVGDELNGKSYKDLSDEQQERVDECTLRQILFHKGSTADLKFEIFKRLNSGATPLNNQEMRNCVYHGTYNDLLRELAKDKDFKVITGFVEDHKRMRDIEYVLRFAALYFSSRPGDSRPNYKPSMVAFMNEEMNQRREIAGNEKEELKKKFNHAVASTFTVFGRQAFRRWIASSKGIYRESKSFNTGLYDVIMWSFTQYDRNTLTRNADSIREAMIDLTTSNSKFIDAISVSTGNIGPFKERFDIWCKALDDILRQDKKQPRCFSFKLKKEYYDNDPVCSICDNKINDIDDAAMDHIEQYWLGGKTVPENARLVHRHCNAKRLRKE